MNLMNPINFFHNILFETVSAETTKDNNTADVIITHNNGSEPDCDIKFAAIKKRMGKLLNKGIANGFKDFPINKESLQLKVLNSMLKEKEICNVITADPGVTVKDHNDIRNEYKGKGLSKDEAWKKGVVAKRIGVEFLCSKPEEEKIDDKLIEDYERFKTYKWKESPVYNGVDECEDVIKASDKDGLPIIMYSVAMQADDVQDYLDTLSTAPLYTRYADDGKPVQCSSGANFEDSFHKILIANWLPNKFKYLKYVMRAMSGEGWSAWQLRRSCTGIDGKIYNADDLKFDFGARIMASLDVEIDGQKEVRTIIMGTVAAAGTSILAKTIPPGIPYKRLIGADYSKRVFLEAKSKGWEIKDK